MTPLKERPDALGRLLKAAAKPLPSEPNARARVREQVLGRPTPRPLWRVGLASVAVGALVAVLVAQLPGWLMPRAQPLTSCTVAGLAVTAQPGAAGTMSARSITVRSGVVDLVASEPTTIELPRAHVETFNSRLRVAVSEVGDTAVLVYQGSAALRPSSSRVVEQVVAGQQWASAQTIDRAELLHREALRLEREGQPRRALQVLEALAPHSGAWGELSLYDAARIHLSVGEHAAALDLVEQHQQRFPAGALSTEVAVLRERLQPGLK